MVPRKKRHSARNSIITTGNRETTSKKAGSISNRTKTSKKTKSERKKKAILEKRQSPIDIRQEIVHHDEKKCQKFSLLLNYSPGDCCQVTTNSSGFRVDVNANNCTSYFQAHHLPGKYQLAQFHAHWGNDGSCGSEHRLDGRAMSGEVHFVFWNTKYGNVDKAMDHGNGLAVLAVFLKEGEESSNYQPLFEAIQEAHKRRKPASLPVAFDLEQLLPSTDNRDFATYPGSLTTSPYAECVIWTLFLTPVEVSKQQLDLLRSIAPANYRECQDLCHREVLSSTSVISS